VISGLYVGLASREEENRNRPEKTTQQLGLVLQ